MKVQKIKRIIPLGYNTYNMQDMPKKHEETDGSGFKSVFDEEMKKLNQKSNSNKN